MQYIIQKSDLVHNIQAVKEEAGDAKIIGVLKGNGYGFGRDNMAQLLLEQGIEIFAVTEIEDAEALLSGILKGKDLLLLRSSAVPEEVERILDCGAIATIGSVEAAACFNTYSQAKGKIGRCHLKIDTGMGRYGFLASETDEMCRVMDMCKNIRFEGAYTHFSAAFTDVKKTKEELDLFLRTIEQLAQRGYAFDMIHAANSSACFNVPDSHLDAVRIGSAFTGRILGKQAARLKRVGYLEAPVVDITAFPKGHPIGYNGTFTAKRATKAAIIPVGHTDGWGMQPHFDAFSLKDAALRGLMGVKEYLGGGAMYVGIGEKKYRVIGQIGLSHTAVDVTDSDVKPGDIAKLDFPPIYLNPTVKREFRE